MEAAMSEGRLLGRAPPPPLTPSHLSSCSNSRNSSGERAIMRLRSVQLGAVLAGPLLRSPSCTGRGAGAGAAGGRLLGVGRGPCCVVFAVRPRQGRFRAGSASQVAAGAPMWPCGGRGGRGAWCRGAARRGAWYPPAAWPPGSGVGPRSWSDRQTCSGEERGVGEQRRWWGVGGGRGAEGGGACPASYP